MLNLFSLWMTFKKFKIQQSIRNLYSSQKFGVDVSDMKPHVGQPESGTVVVAAVVMGVVVDAVMVVVS